METIFEFLISQGIGIAQSLAWRLCQFTGERFPRTQPFLNSVTKAIGGPSDNEAVEKINNLSERTLATAQNHIQQALAIVHSAEHDNVDENQLMAGKFIPEKARRLAEKACNQALKSFNDRNLSVKQRAKAMQICMVSLAIEHFDEPKIVTTRWAEQIKLIGQNVDFKSSIDVYLRAGFFRRTFAGCFGSSKREDFDQIVHLIQDASKALCFYPFCEGRKALVMQTINESTIKTKWMNKLQLSQHNYNLTLAPEARAYDITAIPGGSLLVSTMIQKLFLYQLGPRIATNELIGHFSSLAYDDNRQKVWALKSTSEFYLVDLEDFSNPQKLDGPDFPAENRRWRVSASNSYVMVAVEYESGAKNMKPLVYLSPDPAEEGWSPIDTTHVTGNRNINSVALSYRRSKGLRIAMCVPKALVTITLDRKEPYNEIRSESSLLPEKLNGLSMACATDEDDNLIVAVYKKGIVVLDSDWKEAVLEIPDPNLFQPQGVSVADGQIYVLVASGIRVYDYVVV